MKYIKYAVYSGKDNMDIDSNLLEEAISNETTEPILRLYGWKPKCISLGRNQKDDFLNNEYADKIDCVRRLTGGRALLHDNEITYSYISPVSIIPNGESITESYKFISGLLMDFFSSLGVKLEFGENKKISAKFDYCMLISTGADVCYNGKKIIGSAQYRKNGYILQHGSILFGYDKSLLEKLFNEEISTDVITTVNEILPEMTKENFVKSFEQYFNF